MTTQARRAPLTGRDKVCSHHRAGGHTRLVRRTAFLAVIASLSTACLQPPSLGDDCSRRACESGLLVDLVALPSQPFKVEITDSTSPNPRVLASYECSGGASCRQDIKFADLNVLRPEIRVSIGMAMAVTTPGEIVYRPVYPNGTDCPPLCLIGEAEANVPSGRLVSSEQGRMRSE